MPTNLPSNFTYSNTNSSISDPLAGPPLPVALTSTSTYNHKGLEVERKLEKAGEWRQVSTQTYNNDKLMISHTMKSEDIPDQTFSMQSESFTYDVYGNVLTHTDPKQFITTYTYDTLYPAFYVTKTLTYGAHTLESWTRQRYQTYPKIGTETLVYRGDNGSNRTVSTTYDYDSFGNVTEVQTPLDDGRRQQIHVTYNSVHAFPAEVKKRITEGSQETFLTETFEYDDYGQLIRFWDGNASDNPTSANPYTYAYDTLGRMTSITYPKLDGETIRHSSSAAYTFNPSSETLTVQIYDEEGKERRQVYDGIGRLSEQWMPDDNGAMQRTMVMHYNALGQLARTEDGEGESIDYQYDAAGRKTKEIYSDESVKEWRYQEATRSSIEIDERGARQVTYSDELGRTIRIDQQRVNPNQTENVLETFTTHIQYEYNGDPLKKRVIDPKNLATLYHYNGLGLLSEVEKVVDGLTERTQNRYNNVGWATKLIFANGSVKHYGYDEAGRLTSRSDLAPATVLHPSTEYMSYDANHNLVSQTDLNQATASFTYDKWNRLNTQQKGQSVVHFKYDRTGKRTEMTDNWETTAYDYYDHGGLKKVTYQDGKFQTYTYDKAGNRLSFTDPFGEEIRYELGARHRVDAIHAGQDPMPAAAYDYEDNGMLSTLEQSNGVRTSYTYDGINRLTGVTHVQPSLPFTNSLSYQYDKNFNLTSRTENGLPHTFTYDEWNRVATSSQYNETYTYTALGDRQTMQTDDVQEMIQDLTYTYDEWNRLTKVEDDVKTIVVNRYDGEGKLREQDRDGVTKRFYYDGSKVIAEAIIDGISNELYARYVRGNILIYREDALGNRAYYVHNGQGDVIEMRDESGELLNKYTYTIWGQPEIVEEEVENPFLYAGEMWDADTGLYYLSARWYDPALGRFINKDTYEGEPGNPLSLNLYTYVYNNPVFCFLRGGFENMGISNKSA